MGQDNYNIENIMALCVRSLESLETLNPQGTGNLCILYLDPGGERTVEEQF